MKRKDILVTGGAGYIGSHTVVELYNSGYRPIIVDDLSNTSLNNISGIEKIIGDKISFYKLDCTNEAKMNELFKKESPLNFLSLQNFLGSSFFYFFGVALYYSFS